jgi:hypothetical protein
MKKSIFLFVLLGGIVLGCSKEQVATNATITFVEPLVGDTLNLSEEVIVQGSINGNGEMHGFSLIMTNLSTGAVVYQLSSHEHLDSYSFHEHWANNVADTSNIRVEIQAILDHEGATIKKSVDVVCLPQ